MRPSGELSKRGAGVTRWGAPTHRVQNAGGTHPRRDAQVLDIHLIDNHKRGYFVIVARGAKAAKRWPQDVGLATDKTRFGVRRRFPTGNGRTAPNRFAESKGAVGLQNIPRDEVVQRGVLRESRESRTALQDAQGLQTSGRPRAGLDEKLRAGKETHDATRCSCGP